MSNLSVFLPERLRSPDRERKNHISKEWEGPACVDGGRLAILRMRESVPNRSFDKSGFGREGQSSS